MTNAEKFKKVFGYYATEMWAKPEKEFLEWINAEALEQEPICCKDCKHFNDGDCEELPKIVSETDFCSFAERKELPSKEIINMKSVFNLSEDVISRRETLKGYQSVCKDIACHECRAKDVDGTCRLESFINNLPSTDRPTGHWIENDNGTFSCSNCQSWIPKEQHHYARHCLYCGARMESEE